MSLRPIAASLALYLAELQLCMSLGATPVSQFELVADTCRFHLANRLSPGRRPEPPRSYAVKLGDRRAELWLRPLSGDFFVLHELFVGHVYHVPLAWRTGVRTVVDLGANVGLCTMYLRRSFPHASFVCVEPDPANAELTRRNTAPLGSQVQVLEAAVSDTSGEALFDNTRPTWGGRLRTGSGPGSMVRCVTMDEVLSLTPEGTIDLLKMDIEGAEARVLRGPCEWLRAVGALVIELHPPYSEALFSLTMERHGFTVVRPDPALGNRMLFALNPRLHVNSPALQASP